MSQAEPHPLTRRFRQEFSTRVRARGADYFQRGRVARLVGDARSVSARVRGSDDTYHVSCRYEPKFQDLDVACTCPYYVDHEGMPCKHIWATLLSAENSGTLGEAVDDPRRVGLYPVSPSSMPDPVEDEEGPEAKALSGTIADEVLVNLDSELAGADLNTLELVLGERLAKAARRTTQRAKKRTRAPTWRTQFQSVQGLMHGEAPPAAGPAPGTGAVRQQQVLYLIDTRDTLAWSEAGLIVETHVRKRKKNGEWGKPQTRRIRRQEAQRLPDADDREILSLLLGAEGGAFYGYGMDDGSTSRYEPPAAMQPMLLHALCRTGRCFPQIMRNNRMVPLVDRPPLEWDDGPAWELWLEIRSDKRRKRYLATGSLRRGEQRLPLDQPLVLTPGGIMITRRHAARFDDHGAFAWLRMMRREREIVIPASDRDELVQSLLSAPRLPRLDLEEELQFERVQGVPTPRLMLRSPDERSRSRNERSRSSRLLGELSFEYEGEAVDASDPRPGVTRGERRLIVRDAAAERDAELTLRELGFRDPPLYAYGAPHAPFGVLELTPRHLPRVVDTLTGAGWRVEADGKLYRQPSGTFDLEIKSGVDWFELHGGAAFGDQNAPLPELLRAMKQGQRTVQLDDGTYGMLPEQWLDRYARLAELGENEGEHVRFRNSQAALLDALLEAQPEATCDAAFQRLSRRLRSFRGVEPADPPETFVGALRGYQHEGLGWLHFLREFGFGGCLADDMGLGKTVQVLALLEDRRLRSGESTPSKKKTPPPPPSLAVVPRSLVHNWVHEAAHFTPQMRVLAHHGPSRTRGHEHFNEYDLIVTTYGTLRRDAAEFAEARFDYALLDEAQAIKNHKTASAKAARLLRADHRLALTGTPIENRLTDLWSIFEFLNPGMLGRASVFKKATTASTPPPPPASPAPADNGDGNGGGDGGGGDGGGSGGGDGEAFHRRLLARALRPFILRRTKQQVASDLPEKLEQTIDCDLPPRQRRQYNELRDHYRQSLLSRVDEKGLNRSKMHVLEALLRLRQAACHPGLIDKSRASEPSGKLDTLLPQLAEVVGEGHKALVFSQFTTLLGLVRDRLDHRGLTYEYLDGRTRKRARKIERFQNDPECGLFLISLKAGGTGLNLTAADYVFLLDPWWNPAVEAQAIDRTHRIGQTRRVFACRLIARDTVEEKVIELQNAKRDLADAIINADGNLLSRLDRDDLRLLLS